MDYRKFGKGHSLRPLLSSKRRASINNKIQCNSGVWCNYQAMPKFNGGLAKNCQIYDMDK